MKRNLIFTLLLVLWGSVGAQCPPGQDFMEVLIVPDNYPQETSWELFDGGGTLVTSGTTNSWSGCVDTTECMEFIIYDTFGDGICCAYGNGSYTIVINGDTVATGGAFTNQENVNVGSGCGAGINCAYADTIPAGSYQAMGPDHWYVFIPPANGTYYINTCTDNCDTKIWVYDHCTGLYWDNTNAGTIYYNDNQCGL